MNKKKLTEKLQNKRKKIDLIDKKIILLLSKRFEHVFDINKIKESLSLPPLQKNRFIKMLKSRQTLAKKKHLNKNFIKHLFELIHQESIKIQKGQRKKNE